MPLPLFMYALIGIETMNGTKKPLLYAMAFISGR